MGRPSGTVTARRRTVRPKRQRRTEDRCLFGAKRPRGARASGRGNKRRAMVLPDRGRSRSMPPPAGNGLEAKLLSLGRRACPPGDFTCTGRCFDAGKRSTFWHPGNDHRNARPSEAGDSRRCQLHRSERRGPGGPEIAAAKPYRRRARAQFLLVPALPRPASKALPPVRQTSIFRTFWNRPRLPDAAIFPGDRTRMFGAGDGQAPAPGLS